MKTTLLTAALLASTVTLGPLLGLAHATGRAAQQNAAQAQQVKVLDAADRKFILEAAAGNLFEVKIGQIAARQAVNEDVKKFGQRMVDDHTKMNGELGKLAQQKGITLLQTLDKKQQDKIDKLAKQGGPDFDKAYLNEIVDEHEHDVDAFDKAAREAKDPAVKSFAASTLPTLRDHLTSVKELRERVKSAK